MIGPTRFGNADTGEVIKTPAEDGITELCFLARREEYLGLVLLSPRLKEYSNTGVIPCDLSEQAKQT